MNLLALPDEMLTNVFKYTNFGRIRQLRTMNKRLDRIAKSRRFANPPVRHFEIGPSSISLHVNKCQLEEEVTEKEDFVTSTVPITDGTVLFQQIEYLLSVVKVSYCFSVKDMLFDNILFESIKNCEPDFRSLKTLQLHNVTLSVSQENWKEFFYMCRNIDDIWIRKCDGPIDNIISRPVLGNRRWKSFWLETDGAQPNDTAFLLEVAGNSTNFLSLNSIFTVSEVLEALKKWSVDDIRDRSLRIGKCLAKGMNNESVYELFEKLVIGLRCQYRRNGAAITTIKLNHWQKDSYVEFTIIF